MEAPYSLSKGLFFVDKLKTLQEGKPIAPTNMQVDLEAYCNDNCEFCSYRAEESHNAKAMLGLIEGNKLKIIDDFKPIGKPTKSSSLPLYFAVELPKQLHEAEIPSVTFTGGGESTIWPAYDKLIDECVKYKIEIGLITNASTLTDHRIEMMAKHYKWVRLSMDAATPQTHKAIHRTPNNDFERRIKGIKKLVELRKEFGRTPNKIDEGLTVGVNFVITDTNILEIIDACKLYSSLGLDYIRFSFMYIDGVGIGQISKENLELCKKTLDYCVKTFSTEKFIVTPASYKIDSYQRENDDFNCCYMQRFVWALAADCKVYPCCIQKYMAGWELADIRDMTLKQMVDKTHEKMNALDVKKCPPCWMRDRNKAMSQGVLKPKHANFV